MFLQTQDRKSLTEGSAPCSGQGSATWGLEMAPELGSAPYPGPGAPGELLLCLEHWVSELLLSPRGDQVYPG